MVCVLGYLDQSSDISAAEILRLYPAVPFNSRYHFLLYISELLSISLLLDTQKPPLFYRRKMASRPYISLRVSSMFTSSVFDIVYAHNLSRCVYSVFLMHRREDLWGADGMFL